MTMDARKLEDWFGNELFKDMAEDGRTFIREEEDKEKMEIHKRKIKYRKRGMTWKYK